MSPLETKLRVLVASLDDSALEALASKGLLRRAQKDIERGVTITVEQEDAARVTFKVDQFKVTIPEAGPARATCSCPAAGVCQHILAAVLYLKQSSPATEQHDAGSATGLAEQELMSLTREQLEDWAGKANFRAALDLTSHSPAEILMERGIVICLPALNSRCHYSPGSGLDGVIVSGNVKEPRRIVAAAVIAFQKAKGIAWETTGGTTAPLEESAGAPRSRAEVLEAANQILIEMLNNGLARISSAKKERLATLAVSALGVNLPRLSLALRGLSDECALVAARDARCDLGRMMNRMSQTHALCVALQHGGATPRADLVGWHRTHYDEIGQVDLIGVAAWPWRTASGYAGLTVLLWDTLGKQWNSWSDSRPLHQQRDFHPLSRYTQPGPWEGAESPRQLARNCFRLKNARRNPLRRLSSSTKSRALVTGPAKIQDLGLPIIEDWSQLIQPLQAQISVGLKEVNPLDSIVLLKPSDWGQRAYNPITQTFSWMLLDSQKRPLLLQLAFDPFTEPAIKFFEATSPETLAGAIVGGRIQRGTQGLSLHPYSVHRSNGEVINVCLDTVTTANSNKPAAAHIDDEEEFSIEEESDQVIAASPVVSRLLDEVDDVLLSVAETGMAGLNPLRIQKLEQLVPRIERLNLQALAIGLGNIVTAPKAAAMLRCGYLSGLCRAAMPLAA